MNQQIDREEIDWEKVIHIADGPDSHVFLAPNGQQVIKRYSYPLAVVQAYVELTNRAAIFLEQTPCYGFLYSKEGRSLFGIDYAVNPIDKLVQDQDANPVTYSKFIRGPRHLLEGTRQSYYWWNNGLSGISLPERKKLDEVKQVIEDGGFQNMHLLDLGRYLDEQLNVHSINLAHNNVKMRFDEATGRIQYIVTDLTSSFKRIDQLWPTLC